MLNFTMGNNNSGEGNWGEIRPRDETGHRTGLGTIAREFVAHPIDTTKAVGALASSYSEMRKANTVGGNILAHEKANYEATKIMGNPKLAAGISAAREEYKNFRVSSGDGPARKGYGDTRTPQERQNTMEANQRGRDQAMAELKKK